MNCLTWSHYSLNSVFACKDVSVFTAGFLLWWSHAKSPGFFTVISVARWEWQAPSYDGRRKADTQLNSYQIWTDVFLFKFVKTSRRCILVQNKSYLKLHKKSQNWFSRQSLLFFKVSALNLRFLFFRMNLAGLKAFVKSSM